MPRDTPMKPRTPNTSPEMEKARALAREAMQTPSVGRREDAPLSEDSFLNADGKPLLGWWQGHGVDALEDVLEGRKAIADVRQITLSVVEYRHAVDCNDIFRDVAETVPAEPERMAYSQARDERMRLLMVEKRLTVHDTRDYAAERWVDQTA